MTTAATPFKIDKIGNVTDRESGKFLGSVYEDGYGGYYASFSHIPLSGEGDVENVWTRFIEEVGRPPHTEDFRKRKDAAEFLWETREFARESFPPPPFQGPRWSEEFKGFLVGDSTVSGWNQSRRPPRPHFTKDDDRWCARGLASELVPGQTATLHKRSGESTEITVGEIIETSNVFGVEFVTTEIVKTPRKSGSSSPRSSRSSKYPRYLRECPQCGEENGGMFNGWRCDECGFRR